MRNVCSRSVERPCRYWSRALSSLRMRRRPSPLVRSLRAFVGLATIWCLGCSSYEPFLDSLLGTRAGTMMATRGASCGGEEGASGFKACRCRNARRISHAISEAHKSETVSTLDLPRQREGTHSGTGHGDAGSVWRSGAGRAVPCTAFAATQNKIFEKTVDSTVAGVLLLAGTRQVSGLSM